MLFIAFLLLVTSVWADIAFYKPLHNQVISGADGQAQVFVGWIESSDGPPISSFTNYTFSLLTGPNTNISRIEILAANVSSSTYENNSFIASIDQDIVDDGLYYIQLVAANETAHTIHYTNRFNLTNMTGPSYVHGEYEQPPDAFTSLSGQSTTMLPTEDISKYFTIPYNQQTGYARYAPMQSQPGSEVTLSTWNKRYPASAQTYFTTVGQNQPDVSYTITQPANYPKYTSINYATYGVQPDEASWYPASKRIVKPILINDNNSLSTTTFHTPMRVDRGTSIQSELPFSVHD